MQRLNRPIWLVIAAASAIVIASSLVGPFHIDWASFSKAAAACVPLCGAGWFYTRLRNDRRAGATLISTAQIIAFSAVGAPLSYLAARAGFPLQDSLFATWDHRLGIDWPGYVSFVTGHVWLHRLLVVAYLSFTVQVIATVLVLGFAGHFLRLSAFVRAFLLTTLITIAISAFVPAMGPWLFYNAQPDLAHGAIPVSSTSWPVFLGLRNGTFSVMSGLNSEGIITFPSLHAALGVLFVMAVWHIRGLRMISLALNTLMILATPFAGSHYVVDVIVGIAIALACWFMMYRTLRTYRTEDATPLSSIAQSPSISPDIGAMVSTRFLDPDPHRAESRVNVSGETEGTA